MKRAYKIAGVVCILLAGVAYAAGSLSVTKVQSVPGDGVHVLEDRGVRCYIVRETSFAAKWGYAAISCVNVGGGR